VNLNEAEHQALRGFAIALATELIRIADGAPRFFEQAISVSLFALAPWLSSVNRGNEQLEVRKATLASANFDGQGFVEKANELLSSDQHLGKCCPTPIELFMLLDRFLLGPLILALRERNQIKLEQWWADSERLIYRQGEFAGFAISHLFNFEKAAEDLQYGPLRVVKLDNSVVGRALGDRNLTPFTYTPGVGDYYVISHTTDKCPNLFEWIYGRHVQAEEFCNVLQFYKDGVVHVDYSVLYFAPEWVNEIRKNGIFFIGSPRRFPYESASKPFQLSAEDFTQLQTWLSLYKSERIQTRLAETNAFRQALIRAGQYYEASLRRELASERLIDLAICLESLFTSGNEELTLRISHIAAQLIGTDPEWRLQIYKAVKTLYGRRSKLFHGQDIKITHQEIDTWSSIARHAYLRLLTLYLRGENDRDKLLLSILESGLDASAAETLRRRSDINVLVAELGSSASA
jgi:Apea-like HEPN